MSHQTNHPQDFIERLRALEREVAVLRRGITLNGAVLSHGVMEVRNAAGDVVARIGKFVQDGVDVYGVAVYDAVGNTLATVDSNGTGLARPYIPVPFASASTTVPTDTTASATFVDLAIARYRPQHPRLSVNVLARASDGTTTGEVQVLVGGVALAAAQTVTAGMFGYLQFGPAALPIAYAHLASVDVTVQARRTAGPGTIGVRVMAAYGEQT